MKHVYTIELLKVDDGLLWKWILLEDNYIIEESIANKIYKKAAEEAYSRYCFYTLNKEEVVLRSTIK